MLTQARTTTAPDAAPPPSTPRATSGHGHAPTAAGARRRVAVLVESSVWGGLEVHAMDLVRVLNQAGCDAFVACVGAGTVQLFRRFESPDVPLVEIAPPARRGFLGWWQALGRLAADAVIFEKGTLNTGSAALDLALRLRFGTFITIENLEPPRLPARTSTRHLGGRLPGLGLWWYRWKLNGWLRSLAPRTVVCCSDSVKRALCSDYHFRPSKVMPVRNGVDVARFRPDAARRLASRRAWGVPEDAFVFGSIRRFVHEKGLDVAIDAFARIAHEAAHANSYLVLVGEGPEEAALRAQARAHGLEARVILPGFSRTPWDVYPAFDAFIIPSRIEALGIVAAEAMACECFVIGSAVGGIPEIVNHPDIGMLVPPADPDALAAAMRSVRSLTAEQLIQIGRAARRHAVDEYDAQQQYLRIASYVGVMSPVQGR